MRTSRIRATAEVVALESGVSAVARPARTRTASRPGRIGYQLRTNGLLIGSVGIFAGISSIRLPKEITQDTWLSLLVGRRIANHGIPRHDILTAWTLGKNWVDQQWLSHLLSYGIFAAGGLVLLALAQVLLVTGAVSGAISIARRSGASARTITWLLVVTLYPILLGAGNVRTQMFVLPLFVAVLALLVSDARSSSGRVFLALPIVVLWANLHGSVVIAAGLVLLRGVVGLFEGKDRVRYGLLSVGAVLAPAVTPYGVGIVHYYKTTLLNPAFRQIIPEWGSPTPSLLNIPIYVLVGVAIWLLARHVKETGRFALLAELALIALSLAAVRSVVWLGLGSIVLLAPALDAELRGKELSVERINRAVGVLGCVFLTTMLLGVLSQGNTGLAQSYPLRAGDVVARAAAARPNVRVYSNERFADWLLYEHPALAGRVDFDARFELLSSPQLQEIFDWTNQIGDHWRQAAASSGVIVLDMSDEQSIEHSLRHDSSLREAYVDRQIAVFVRR